MPPGAEKGAGQWAGKLMVQWVLAYQKMKGIVITMKMKRFIAMVLSIAVMITALGTTAYAVELESAYQITDEYVVIDSI